MKLNNDSNGNDSCTNNELTETEIKYNEIKQYINTRYVCPPPFSLEAMNCLLEYHMYELSHVIYRFINFILFVDYLFIMKMNKIFISKMAT